jgi:hypothetical protein
MGLGWKNWNRSDVIYGIVVPIIVVLVIVVLSQVGSIFERGSYGIITGIVSEIEEIVVIVAVPLLLGLAWNRWAGGASGFLLGSLFAMWFAVKYGAFSGGSLLTGLGPTILGYVLSAMLIGYMAGALNKRSENFMRMVVSGVAATTIGGLFLFGIFQLSPMNVMIGLNGFLLTVLSRTAAGVIIPIIAKVFMWYGIVHNRPSSM